MPTYEYHCDQCGCFDFQQSMKDDPLQHCPDCGSAVHRKISRNVGIVFKGTGFYITDSRTPQKEKTPSEAAS